MIFNAEKFVDEVVSRVKEQKLVMKDFEKNVGVSVGYFSRCLNSKTKSVSVELVLRCAKLLNCDIKDLL